MFNLNQKVMKYFYHETKKTGASIKGILVLVLLVMSSMAYAQQPLISNDVPYEWEYNNKTRSQARTGEADHIIEIADATWLRVYFEKVNLGANGYVKITSLTDGATQILDATKMKQWNNSSAYFNGNKVAIDIVDPDKNVTLSVKEVDAGEPQVSIFSQCGPNDDRISSNDAAIGRIVPVGCTGWIIKNGKMVTAGHCTGSSMQVLEFNVPQSNSNGSIVHPDPSDQYTITNVIEGSLDWAVFETFDNSQTGLSAIDAQGKSFDVKQVSSAGTIRITGYGVDTGSSNQTQQTHTGPFSSATSSKLYYTVDTEGGNSGSPVVEESSGLAIGVHTNGGCGSTGTNSGTNAQVSAFWNAMGLDTTPVDPCENTVSSFPYNESFESGIGLWTQYTDDNLNWTVDASGTPSSGTGPSSATDGSNYLYVEASGSGTGYPNKTAVIATPCFNLGSLTDPALSFSYHMNGTSMGSLSVETSTDDGDTWTSIWSVSGSQGSAWNDASVSLPSTNGLAVRFYGTTGSSWSSDIAIDKVSVGESGGDPDPDCETIDFSSASFSSYSIADDGNYTVQNGGSTLLLEDNTWQSVAFNYTVTSNTILEFDFRSTSEGEIHGIGFDTDANTSTSATFQLYGTQNWGVSNYNNYSGTSWVTYTIPVGSFYTGTFDRIFFSNDNDAGSGNNSYFRNVLVHEGGCSENAKAIARSANTIVPVIANEGDENVIADLAVFPNPATTNVNIYLGKVQGDWSLKISGITGQEYFCMEGNENKRQINADLSDLPGGIYMISLSTKNGQVNRKIIKQ